MNKICLADDCVKNARSKGFCPAHYANFKRTGDPLPRMRPSYGSTRSVTRDGYVRLWEPSHPLAKAGYVAEHRKVAWEAGLLTDPSHHVHHLDGDRTNNDLSNLEVLEASAHAREHARASGFITNQYGTWPLRDR